MIVYRFIVLLIVLLPSVAVARPLVISCGPKVQIWHFCAEAAQAWAAEQGVAIKVVSTPLDSNASRSLQQQQLQQNTVDVFLADITTPQQVSGWLAPLDSLATPAFDADSLAASRVNGQLLAMPWYQDVGVLYYRRDLLEKHGANLPQSWDALAQTAQTIQQAENLTAGYTFAGRVDETLTCQGLEWLAAHNQQPPFEKAVMHRAISPVRRMLAQGISPPGSLNYDSEAARGLFQAGEAVFMRNWSYAWRLLQQPGSTVRGKVGMATLPGGVSCLGGWGFMLAALSPHAAQARALIAHLTSKAVQQQRLRDGFSQRPTITLPPITRLQEMNPTFVLRPNMAKGYNQWSFDFADKIYQHLSTD